MRFLRQNTAVLVTVGPFYDKTDGVTIETALTITNERITLTADTDDNSAPTNVLDNVTGATSGTSNDLNYITGNDAGMMQLELSAANTNRVGRCLLSITDSANHVPVFHEFFILPQAIYDWLVGVVTPLPANVTHFGGSAGTFSAGRPEVNATHAAGTAWNSGAIGASTIATGAIDADALATDAVNEIRAAITGGAYALDTDANGRVRIVDGTAAGELDTTSGGVLVAALSTAAKAEVQTEAEEALVTYNLDHLLAVGAVAGDVANSSIVARLTSKNATPAFTSFNNTTDSLEAIKDYTASEATLGSVQTNVDNAYLIVASATYGNAALKTLIDTVDTVADAILADTGTDGVVVNAAGLATDAVQEIRNAITGGAYALDTDANGRVRVVDGTGAGELDTASGAVAATVAALTDARAEPSQGTPSASASALGKLDWLYFAWRNKKESTADYGKIFDDVGTTVVTKSAKSDDTTTFTAGEFVTGP
jgi:anti-sigma28 factor (negative regulator of flagellin synthesis)